MDDFIRLIKSIDNLAKKLDAITGRKTGQMSVDEFNQQLRMARLEKEKKDVLLFPKEFGDVYKGVPWMFVNKDLEWEAIPAVPKSQELQTVAEINNGEVLSDDYLSSLSFESLHIKMTSRALAIKVNIPPEDNIRHLDEVIKLANIIINLTEKCGEENDNEA